MTFKNFFRLCIASMLLFAACTPNDGTGTTDENNFALTQISASTTGVIVEWNDEDGDSATYTVNVYTDSELKELQQSYTLQSVSLAAKRFSVPYLDTDRSYFVVVEDASGNKSKTLEVALTDSYTRRVVLKQNFDNLFWGYDYIHSASGVKLGSNTTPATYRPENLTDAIADSEPTSSVGDDGGLLFKYHASTIQKMGFEGWSGTEVRVRPGYAKLGSGYNTGSLISPAFEVLGESVETVELSFSACTFASTYEAHSGTLNIALVKEDGSKAWEKSVTLKRVEDKAAWNNYEFSIDNVSADCHLEISTNASTKQVCIDNILISRKFTAPEGCLYGFVTDRDTGLPIEGVAMSDGFSVVATDEEGFYKITPHQDAWYVYYSIPADCAVLRNSGHPKFYTRITEGKMEYNFELRKLPNGKEEKFALITLGDPQVSSNTALGRFTNEAVPGIKKYISTLDVPCYGITLGDIVSTSSGNNSGSYMEMMRTAMTYQDIGMPVFQVMGNHDCICFNEDNPLEPDETSSTIEMKAQRAFETIFGPINYSFNRGDVHIIGMRNIIYGNNEDTSVYSIGFLPEQYQWLKEDLALVPKDKMVVLCVHSPLRNYRTISTNNVKQVHALLNQYAEAHIISGHTHVNRNYEPTTTYPNIYEHNTGTVCGTWWVSNVCGDGTPNGFGVFMSNGPTFNNWYYMGYSEGMNDRNYQMRLYRGNSINGAPKDENKNGQEGYYAFNFSDDTILANVFNADSTWKIEVYENGEYSGDMTRVNTASVRYKDLTGSRTFEDPARISDEIEADYDMWVVGFHLGVLDRYKSGEPSNGSWSQSQHMYKYQLRNPDAEVKVVATDRFGTKYEATEFVDYRNLKLIAKP